MAMTCVCLGDVVHGHLPDLEDPFVLIEVAELLSAMEVTGYEPVVIAAL